MSAFAMLLHRKLILSGARGWRSPDTSAGGESPAATRHPSLGNELAVAKIPESQVINTDQGTTPDRTESPQYLSREHRKLPHG